MFAITAAYIVSLALCCIFFGLSLATFILCIRTLCAIPFRSFTRARWALLTVASLMLAVGATAIGQQLRRNLNAFVYFENGTQATQELNDPKDPMNHIHTATYPIQTFLGDSVFIFRTLVVYEYDWKVVIVPILLMIGDTVCGWGITWAESSLTTGAYTSPIIQKWMYSYIVLALSLNLTCTVLITTRILKISRTSADAGITGSARALKQVMWIIVESGLIYTIHSLLFLIFSTLKSNAFYPVADSLIHTMTICFHLVIIRTSNRHQDTPTRSTVSSGLRFAPPGSQTRHTDICTVNDIDTDGHTHTARASFDDKAIPLHPITNTVVLVEQTSTISRV